MLGQLRSQLRRAIARPGALEERSAQAALDALQDAKDGGRVDAAALRGRGQGAAAHQRQRHLEVAGRQSVLRTCNHGLLHGLFGFHARNPTVRTSSTLLESPMDPRAPSGGSSPPIVLVSHALCPYVQRAAIVLAEK